MLLDFPPYSLRQVVVVRLQFAIARFSVTLTLGLDSIPVLRQRDSLDIVYKSAIAFKLAHLCQETLTEIVTQVVGGLPNHPNDFSIEVVSPGWIYFRWSDLGVARWLEYLINLPQINRLEGINRDFTAHNLMPLQFAHARCCSILRLAKAQGLIQIDLSCRISATIPWFNSQGQWYLTNPYEAKAIAALVDLVDFLQDLTQVSEANLLKSGMKLADSFFAFEAHCRIFGEINSLNRDLCHSRLALVAAVKSGFQLIIQNVFNTIPLTEL
jgi:arginyl-tRNA synthetase